MHIAASHPTPPGRLLESRRVMAVGAAIRRCPHRSDCAGCHGHKSACALGKGATPGRVRRPECEACVLADRPELRPGGWTAPPSPLVQDPPMATTARRETGKATDAPPSGVLLDRWMAPASWLDGLYGCGPAFLLCGGPSVRGLDLGPLADRRGFVLAAVNNAPAVLEPAYLRPDVWTHVDDAGHFLDHLWRDPGVMKFTPSHKLGARIREKDGSGRLRRAGPTVGECPNVWCYRRRADFSVGDFLTDPLLSWGKAETVEDPTGVAPTGEKHLSVMLVALRLLYILGIRTVYLLGADFRMRPEAGGQYGFAQGKDARACDSNNRKFAVLDAWFTLLRPEFESKGFHVLNATAGSHLGAFDRIEYDEAVSRARGPCGGPVRSEGWY